jgi:glutamine synthetase
MADRVMLYRHLASNIARSRRLTAAFLPRPLEGGGTPGLPVHQALWKDDRNLFHDDAGWAKTSALCRRWAGGLIGHLPALSAFCAPSGNSYRRLIRGVSGPTRPLLSDSDRQAVCRIPARSDAPAARRVKFWLPDPTANPYLALAAILLAGLDGAERGAEAPRAEAAASASEVPHSLEGALDGLSADRAFLKNGGVFTDAVIDAWIADRWAREVLPVRAHPHPRELAALLEGGAS